jgi:hypothetical protein
MNEITKHKISISLRGRKHLATHCKHISQSLKGRKLTDEHKKKISETGWMPFWWGNKFNRRLSSKRVRQHEKKELEKELSEKETKDER